METVLYACVSTTEQTIAHPSSAGPSGRLSFSRQFAQISAGEPNRGAPLQKACNDNCGPTPPSR